MMKTAFGYSLPMVSPSILACERSNAINQASASKKYGVKMLHFDVMDGHFVAKKTSFYPRFVRSFKFNDFVKDVHLMVNHPLNKVPGYLEAGANIITFHLEAYKDEKEVLKTIKAIQRGGAKAGLSLKPGTPIDALKPYIDVIDLILLMSVEPGLGGQQFMPEAVTRAKGIRKMIEESHRDILLEIDGGINARTSPLVRPYVDIFVTGTHLFCHEDEFQERFDNLTR